MSLKMDNFLSFAIVNGFFIGLLLSFLKFDDPAMIVAGTLVSTMGFYLITLISVSLFVSFINTHESTSKKNTYNTLLEEYISEFDKREKATNKIRGFLRTMEKTMREEEQEDLRNKANKAERNDYADDF
ncbi:hypothetical protein [Helicobacter winghamensis]|uniref:Motility integral membrane protein n=1 Tax=Helicobacter winghamensis TaxID=157268 RepID=A0A2N3PK27_9HELI|nr:hypothetical protein [Helicobacter winghamensis]EEO25744.1 hypothetical protein HWAG_00536 [Helicobacter winghamensis ATCC BAA-430]PKT77941.1 hypothetical protein BCM32_04890 [Helicobacter winghamensis]PKT77975.1 hypothetical protein BCM35_00020 [Helicobacter winghamensis]PKT78949.1 hypothetical protein BCM34_03560 [Helicobacter winghamensis]PKT81728.1 hypothetical protein BCM31_07550 [Helicobacter winghamensis]